MNAYQLAPRAFQDLRELTAYISMRQDALTALRVIDHFTGVFQRLAALPGQGHRREDLTDKPIRFWPVWSYHVIYNPDAEPVEILRVLSMARDVGAELERPAA